MKMNTSFQKNGNQEISQKAYPFQDHPVMLFLVITFLIGFLFIFIALFTGLFVFAYVAAASSSLSGILTATITRGKEGLKDLLGEFKNWQSKFIYYLFAFFFPLITLIIGNGIILLLGAPFSFPGIGVWISFLPTFLLITLQAGLGEEIGWRGYLTPKLSEKYSYLISSLLVGIVWALWHLPLYFIPGFVQNTMVLAFGFLMTFILYSSFIICSAVIISWLFFNSNNNLWLPVIIHGALNTYNALFILTFDSPLYSSIIWIISGILIIILCDSKFKRRKFSKNKVSKKES